MEKVHKSSTRTWISSLFNVKQFRDEWRAAMSYIESSSLKETVNTKEYAEIEKTCGLGAMKCSFQTMMEISKELIIPGNTDLETLRLQKEDLEKRKADPVYEKVVQYHYKEYSYPPRKIPGFENDPDVVHFEKIQEPEVLLSVQIYRPEQKADSFSRVQMLNIFHVDQEFMVFGSQYLVELRDKIECVADKAVPGDCSDMPDIIPEETCGDIYKSGYFYIDGVFYNDMRHPDCRDYSQTIIDWSQNKCRGIGPFQKALMERTQFIDLNMQLGYPYLYTHQGNCEHLIVFNDLLMYTQHYSDNKYDYPVHVNLKPKKRVFCMTCHIYTAEWIVYDNKRVPVNPFFFCKKCFLSYNYDDDDQKIGNFRAYHHYDRSNIL